jgi:hypothetical protein
MFTHPTIGSVARVASNVTVPALRGKVVAIASYRAPSHSDPYMRARVREILDSGELGPEWFIVPGQLIPV